MRKIALFIYVCFGPALFAISSEEIAQKNHVTTSGFKSSISEIELVMTNQTSAVSSKIFISKSLETVQGDKTLIEFIYPKDLSGTKLLTHESLTDTDNQWLYLPSIKRIKKIANANKSSSFMGSEFTYEDITQSHYQKYIYDNGYKEAKIGESVCYVIRRTPKDPTSAFDRQVLFIDKGSFLLLKMEYFKKEELQKTAYFENYQKDNGIYVAYKVGMKNMLTKKESILNIKKYKSFANLSESDFAKRVLEE